MKNLFSILIIILLSTACSSPTSTPIIGPDGSENKLITCLAIQQCYAKAREECRGTYKIVNTSSEVSGVNGMTGTTTKLLVKCDQ